MITCWHRPFSTYAKLSEKLTFLTSWYAHVTGTCAYQGVKNISFSDDFEYLKKKISKIIKYVINLSKIIEKAKKNSENDPMTEIGP